MIIHAAPVLFRTDMGYWIFKAPHHVYKFATTHKQVIYLRREYQQMQLASINASPLRSFLPEASLHFFFIKMRRYRSFRLSHVPLLTHYFQQTLPPPNLWKPAIGTVHMEPLGQVLPNDVLAKLTRYLEGHAIPTGPAHRDFHPANIVVSNQKLVLIDWTNYRSSSSPAFDLLNLLIYGEKSDKQDSFFDMVRQLLERGEPLPDNPFLDLYHTYPLPPAVWMGYLLDKMAIEWINSGYFMDHPSLTKINKIKIISKWVLENA